MLISLDTTRAEVVVSAVIGLVEHSGDELHLPLANRFDPHAPSAPSRTATPGHAAAQAPRGARR